MELLVVVAIIAILMALARPAMNAMSGASTLTKAAEDLVGLLEQARAQAMAKNTYVYVGMRELDSMPKTNTPKDDGGRIAAAVLASVQGVRPNLKDLKDNDLVPISRLFKMENVVLKTIATSANTPPAGTVKNLADTTGFVLIEWPATATSLTFDKVIEFDPQGVARLALTGLADNPNAIDDFIEIPLQPPVGSGANWIRIWVDGITGAVRRERP